MQMVGPSDVLTPPNWQDISSLASLNGVNLLTRYATMHSIRPAFLQWPVGNSPDLGELNIFMLVFSFFWSCFVPN